MRKLWYLGVVAGATLATVLAASPAYAATNVLTYGAAAPGGSAVSVGDVLSAGLKAGTTATFMSAAGGSTGITCTTSTFTATVNSNPLSPSVATETVTGHTFSSCTETISGVTGVNSILVDNLPYGGTTVTSATKAVVIAPPAPKLIQTTVKLNTLLGLITCVYRANLNKVSGVASNATLDITFTNQQFNKFSGPAACFANGYFSAKYGPVRDTSKVGAPTVYVN